MDPELDFFFQTTQAFCKDNNKPLALRKGWPQLLNRVTA